MPTKTLAAGKCAGSERSVVVVGIGASAGGLEAAGALLDHLPADSGMAFVLVQHLDPSQPSLMAELLSRHTQMVVRTAEDGVQLEPDHFYVIPPNVILTVHNGVLKTASPAGHAMVRTHVDTFFRSLAEDQGEWAVGVVLSGAGSDGTVGLRAIKEHGGMTVAQLPASAKFDSMPQNAVGSGMVDFVLAVEKIPAKLVEHARYLENRLAHNGVGGDGQEVAAHLPRICQILQQVTGHDFSGYKPGTMMRRIGRRVQVQHLDSVGAYLALLEEAPDEAVQLFKDLLIGVTQFFRDPDAFDVLCREALPTVLGRKKGGETSVRVWVPGCATGEEAYSVAMLLSECMTKLGVSPQVQVFATDIDDAAIGTARLGRYPASLVEPLSVERRERFFVKHGDGYQVNKQIRDMCIFSNHNLVRDPPFSSLDLVSCRNLLIYMDVWLQKKMIPLFHYALAPGGYLFLGTSEGLGTSGDLFHEIDEKHRLFQRTQGPARTSVIFPLTVPAQPRGALVESVRREDPAKATEVGAAVDRLVLEYAPPCVVINARGDIVYSLGETGAYLQQPTGSPTLNVLDQARKGLRWGLRAAIREATKTLQPAVHQNLPVRTPGGVAVIDLVVRPLPDTSAGAGLLAVIFQIARPEKLPGGAAPAVDESASQQLEVELKATRMELQSTIETLERASEDSKSSNEELLSLNEEMQSANEELQSSKEEMQSVNEELSTVNSELNRKVEQLDGANADLQNLIRSTEIATLFLDRELRIKRFTPAATLIFRLIDGDVGRPLGDFAPRIADVDLIAQMKQVLETLTPSQQQVYLPDRRSWFLMRLLPSRTVADAIDGVVATFVDITVLKEAEDALRQSEERARQLTDAIPALVWTARPDGVWDLCNERVREYKGFVQNADGTWDWAAALHPDDAPRVLAAWRRAVESQEPYQVELRLGGAGGQWRWHLGHAVPIRDRYGHMVRWSGTLTDVHDLRTAQEANVRAETAREVAERVGRNKDEFLAVLSHELRTPLTPVMMSLEMLDGASGIDDATRASLQMIKRNVQLETRLIDDLLDMTRVASGKIELDLQPVDLRVILHRAAEVVMPDVEARKLEFLIDDGGSPLFVSADAVRLQQAFWNVLRNAVKFTPAAGRVTLQAARATREGREGVTVEVSDTGVGIEAEVMPRIFNAFEQGGRATTRRFGGLGLGLSITKTLVTLHGGIVDVRSGGVGEGATFAVWLPLLPPQASPRVEAYASVGGAGTQRKLRILLVEDHVDTAQVMIRLLSTHGHVVEHAGDLATALRLATEHTPAPFDLLISDLGLPDGSGLELIRTLRERGMDLPGIALSGYGQEQEILESRRAGFGQHLVKPVSIPRLVEAIAQLTRKAPGAVGPLG